MGRVVNAVMSFILISVVVLVVLLGLDVVRQWIGAPVITVPSIPKILGAPTSTPRVYPSAGTTVLELRTQARLETASFTGSTVITAERDPDAFLGLWTDRLLFQATATVVAGVDLADLPEDGVTVYGNIGTVFLSLPPTQIFSVTLDEDKSGVFDRQTGLFTKGDTTLEQQARVMAVEEIRTAAEEAGILRLADANAQNFLRRVLLKLGFEQVEFR